MNINEMLDAKLTVRQALRAVDVSNRQARRFVINAAAVARGYDENFDEVPVTVGFISRTPIPADELERIRQWVKRYHPDW